MSYDRLSVPHPNLSADNLTYPALWAHTLDLAQLLPTDGTPGLFVRECTPQQDRLSAHVVWKPTPEADGVSNPMIAFLDIYRLVPDEIDLPPFLEKVRAGMGRVQSLYATDQKLADMAPHLSTAPALQTEAARELLPATARIRVRQPGLLALEVRRRPLQDPNARSTPLHTLARTALAFAQLTGQQSVDDYRELVTSTAAAVRPADTGAPSFSWLTGRS
jgi:hypothetical protein